MENDMEMDAINGEFQLPEAIIQHIQSFLGRKQAAQSSTLSKSWYSAWSTRPHLDFDERFFENRDDEDPNPHGFLEFARMTVQRYEELKLKVDSLKLCLEIADISSYFLAHQLIAKVIVMGASDLELESLSENAFFAFPFKVLGFEKLVRLSAIGCKIDQRVDGKVSCSRLKSLSLCRVDIGIDLLSEIISSCPLIENLLLHDCELNDKTLKLSPSVEFHKLKCLSLEKVNVDRLFFHDFSSKFPCLKDLTLHNCSGYTSIQVYSNSLECISIAEDSIFVGNFNVPSIRKFSFSGSRIPNFYFVATSNEFESDISISCHCPGARLGAQWFQELKLFLRKLTPSKIFLSLIIGSFMESSFDFTGDVHSLPKPAIENLTMHPLTMHEFSLVSSAFLEGVYWSCSPKLITHYWLHRSCVGGKSNREFLEVLCNSLIQEVSENVCVPNRFMFGLLDLEEVNVEIFEESLAEWWLLHWKTLLDAEAFPEHKRKIRFQLRWRS